MKTLASVLLVLGLVSLVAVAGAQDEEGPGRVQPGIEQEPLREATDEPADAGPSGTDTEPQEQVPAEDEETEESTAGEGEDESKQKAVEALLGEGIQEGEEGEGGETEQAGEGADERAAEDEETGEERTPAPLPDDAAVPRIPLDIEGEGESGGRVLSDEESGRLGRYGDLLRGGERGAGPGGVTTDDLGGDAATEGVGGEQTGTGESGTASSSAAVIIIGLIFLALLLVALAAIIGVMAAQQANRAGGAGGDAAGAAYLSAPGAPDIALNAGSLVFGSGESCDLQLADPKASAVHARIRYTDRGYVIADLDSETGTYVNNRSISSPVLLRSGDTIRIGDVTVTFHTAEDNGPAG